MALGWRSRRRPNRPSRMEEEAEKTHTGNGKAVGVVVVAAGRGERAGQADGPKQYRPIGGRPVIARAIEAFSVHPEIGPIVVAIHADDRASFAAAIGETAGRLIVVE